MYLVSVHRIFKIVMRAFCGETTSKVACEISAFYKFVKNSITLSSVFEIRLSFLQILSVLLRHTCIF